MRRISENYVRSRIPKGFNLDAARRIQLTLSRRVVQRPLGEVDLVAGLDVAYVGESAYSVAALYSIGGRRLVEYACSIVRVAFPYVPTLLSFRELKPMVSSFLRLKTKPHVVLIDGHGVAHPYRLGIAAHFGVTMNVPTIGVAKSLLHGYIDGPFIRDPDTGDVLGQVVKCPSRQVYVSVGNLVTLEDAVKLVSGLCLRDSMPEPILMAHQLANSAKRGLIPCG